MNPVNGIENRAYSRVGVEVAVEIQSAPGADALDGNTMICKTRDISLVGMGIYTIIQLPKGSRLLLNIELGKPPRLFNLMGQVMWSAQDPQTGMYKTGIHLTNLPGDTSAWHAAVLQMLIG
jgi:hypothetical protein